MGGRPGCRVTLLVVSALVVLFAGVILCDSDDSFDSFIRKFGKNYKHGSEEYDRRRVIFQNNLFHSKFLNKWRPNNSSAWYGPTKFSDLSYTEFKKRYLSTLLPSKEYHNETSVNKLKQRTGHHDHKVTMKIRNLPPKVDWRQYHYNVVTSVKNQKHCGACWAFASVEALESAYALTANKDAMVLSVQEMIDCSVGYGLLGGCRGGDISEAFLWMKTMGVRETTEDVYPLTDESESCHIKTTTAKGVGVLDYKCSHDFIYNETKILEWIAMRGPVAVSVDATNWNNYLGGIIQYHCGGRPNNHAIVLVGYDMTGEVPYYIGKNSWGDDWGDKGYVYLAVHHNVCGVAREVTGPTKIYWTG